MLSAMNGTQKGENTAFLTALDYILNQSTTRELEALAAAVDRRQKQLEKSGLGSINPNISAKKMADSIHQSIDTSLDGVRNTFRNYAADLLAKEAPELSEAQLKELVDTWIPQKTAQNRRMRSLEKNGMVCGLPVDALYEMILQFTSYGLGEMPKEEEQAIAASVRDWQRVYWERFPAEIKHTIREFLHGKSDVTNFYTSIRELLNIPST